MLVAPGLLPDFGGGLPGIAQRADLVGVGFSFATFATKVHHLVIRDPPQPVLKAPLFLVILKGRHLPCDDFQALIADFLGVVARQAPATCIAIQQRRVEFVEFAPGFRVAAVLEAEH